MQKALTSQHPSEDDCFATDGWLTTSVCWETVKKNSNSSTERMEKTAAGYGSEISAGKSKIQQYQVKTI